MKIINKNPSLILLLLIVFAGCKKNEIPDIPEQEAFFSYLADNFTVTFTNKSRLQGSYNWNFGDGTASAEENPVHVFPGKGRYVVTLKVNANGKEAEATTIMLLDKTSPIRMDDGTIADWEKITKNVVVSGLDGLAVKLGKFDYDANNIYIYIEQQSTIADQTIFSLYIDTDTLMTTGFQMGGFPGMGAELYCEGQIATPDYWFDPYTYNGNGSSWDGWTPLQAGEFYRPGHFEESNGLLKYELALSRTKLKGLDGEAVRIVIIVMDSGWSDLGYMPDGGSNGFLLMMNQ